MRLPTRLFGASLVLAVAVLGTSPVLAQVNGSWNVDANGDYSVAGNWLGGNIAGAGGVFTFGDAYGLSAGRTINNTGAAPTLSGLTYNTPFFSTFDSTLNITAQSGVNFNLNVLDFAGITPTLFGNGALINGIISGTPNNFDKNGPGTITLNAANTFTAPVRILAGELRITTGDAALGNAANTVLLDGGALRISAVAMTSGRAFTIGAGGGTIRTFVASTMNGTLGGTGTLTKEIATALTINGDGSGFTGTVNNFSGSIVLGTATGNLTGVTTFNNSAVFSMTNVTANNSDRFAGNINNRGGQVTIAGNATAATNEAVGTLDLIHGLGVITNDANAAQNLTLSFSSLTRSNRSTFFVRGDNLGNAPAANVSNVIFTGGMGALIGGGGGAGSTNISIVPWAYGNVSAASTTNSTHVTYDAINGIRALNAATEYAASLGVAAPTDNVNVAATQAVAVGGQTINALRAAPAAATNITGGAGDVLTITSGSIINSSATTTILTDIQAPVAFGGAEGVIHANGGVLAAGGTFGGLQISGVISGTNGLTKGGLNILALSGLNTYTGTTTVTGGILLLRGNASNDGSASVLGQSTTAVEFHSSATGSIIAASGGARVVDRDINVTTGASALPVFATTLAADTLTINGDVALATSNNSFSNSFVNFASINPTAGTAAVIAVNGDISGAAGINVNVNATGSLTLTGNNTFAGGTQLGSGTLFIGSNTALGTGVVYTNGAATISASGGARTIANAFQLQADVIFGGTNALTINGVIDLTGGPRLVTVTNTAPVTFAGAVTHGSLIKAGAGELVMSNAGNTYIGSTVIRNGTLTLGASANVGSGALGNNPQTGAGTSGVVQLADATSAAGDNIALLVNGAFTVARPIEVNNNNSAGTSTVGGTNTSGTATFSGNLILDRSANATRLTAAGGGTVNFSGLISETTGLSAVSIVGAGTVMFSNATGNTYTGSTTVSATSTLLVMNTSGSATGVGTVTVNPGGTLGGTGRAGGAVNAAGGNITPGVSPGVLTLGDLTVSAATNFTFELGGGTPGNGPGFYDQLIVENTFNIDGNLTVNTFGGFNPAGGVFFIVARAAGAGSFVGLAEGATVNIDGGTYQGTITYLANWTGSQGTSTTTGGNDVAIIVSAVPEPASLALMFGGLGGIGYLWRRRRNQAALVLAKVQRYEQK